MAVSRSIISLLICCISVCVVIRAAERDGVLEIKSNSPNAPVEATFRSRAQRLRRQASGSRLTEEQRQDFLTAHNNYRKIVDPSAADMQKMVWDYELESMAQEWADNCVWMHGQPQRDNPPYSPIGQNNYATTAATVTGSTATRSWYDEVSDYHFADNTCNPGKVCGHYTQVVWASSNHLGCGIADCPDLENSGLGHAQFVVCNYGPAGNWVGQKPYKEGQPCTSCPASTTCESGLCAQCEIESCENGGTADTQTCRCYCLDGFSGDRCETVDGGTNNESGTTEGGESGTTEGGESGTTEGGESGTTEDSESGTTEGGESGTTEGDESGITEGGESGTTEGVDTTTVDDNDDDCFFFCPRQAGYVATPIKWLYAIVSILVLSNIFG